MNWNDIFLSLGARIVRRDELIHRGATGRALSAAVKSGHLVRVRRDRYALPGTNRHVVEAVSIGGVLDCTSALADIGVFVFDGGATHVRLPAAAARPPSAPNNRRVLGSNKSRDVEVHWRRLVDPLAATPECVGLVDALIQAARCQDPWHTVASIDNALHQKLINGGDVATIFEALPLTLQYLRDLLDGRAESGQESILRLILESASLHYEVQVVIPSVGRVDFLVEGILVLEADSRLAHDGWDAHVRDTNRDITCGQLGYMTLRPLYEHTMHQPHLVLAAIRGVLETARLRGR